MRRLRESPRGISFARKQVTTQNSRHTYVLWFTVCASSAASCRNVANRCSTFLGSIGGRPRFEMSFPWCIPFLIQPCNVWRGTPVLSSISTKERTPTTQMYGLFTVFRSLFHRGDIERSCKMMTRKCLQWLWMHNNDDATSRTIGMVETYDRVADSRSNRLTIGYCEW